MINLKTFIPAILGILGLAEFHQEQGRKVMTDDEKAKLKGYGFNDRFLADFEAQLNEPEPQAAAPGTESREKAAIAAALAQVTAQLDARNQELDTLKASASASAADIAAKQAKIDELTAKVATLSAMPEQDPAPAAGRAGVPAPAAFDLNDDKQLGGRPGVMFSMDRAYNVRARAALLLAEGRDGITVKAESSVDYQSLQDDLGAFYRRPWRERLQSLLVQLPSMEQIFSLDSNHQDLETLVNIWLGEFSQADNTQGSDFDKVTKGSYEFGTETLRMFGVMFVHRFKNLKALEKSWIGYLNREGSNPLKMSFIEFLLAETTKKLINEREQRRVNGVRKEPNVNKPGRALDAADGLYEFLRKKIDGHIDYTPDGGTTGKTVYQIKPFALPRITLANIGEVFYLGTSMIPSFIRDTGNLVLYVPSWMIPLYHKYNEAHYGQNRDYTANILYVKEYPAVKIVAIPNADNHERIFWTLEGNIKLYEGPAGEMLNFQLEQQDWSLKVWSNWKESIWAEAVGFKYTNPADMDGSRQLIWANDYDRPDTYFIDNAPDTNPDALLHSSIVTGANSAAFEITDIANAKVGTVVSIKAGDDKVSIKKTGKFELLTAAWTPKKGDIIRLMKRADGKFIEIERAADTGTAYMFPADEATPSVKGAVVFVTNANTAATAITDLLDAIPATVYTIHGAGKANASTIANGGKFVLTDAMTLEAGKYIQLVKSGDKFYEVARG